MFFSLIGVAARAIRSEAAPAYADPRMSSRVPHDAAQRVLRHTTHLAGCAVVTDEDCRVNGWVFADTWVLASIGVYERRCTLVELIAAGDWMNHAILEADELEAALGKLAGSGLVRVFDDWTFELTDEGTSLFAAEHRSIQTQLDLIEADLATRTPVPAPVRLPKGAVAEAVGEYQRGSS
jgi:hypothetical protein